MYFIWKFSTWIQRAGCASFARSQALYVCVCVCALSTTVVLWMLDIFYMFSYSSVYFYVLIIQLWLWLCSVFVTHIHTQRDTDTHINAYSSHKHTHLQRKHIRSTFDGIGKLVCVVRVRVRCCRCCCCFSFFLFLFHQYLCMKFCWTKTLAILCARFARVIMEILRFKVWELRALPALLQIVVNYNETRKKKNQQIYFTIICTVQ